MDPWIQYVQLIYLQLLHANFLTASVDKRSTFDSQFAGAVASVPKAELARWLNMPWRERMTAAWIIAASPDAIFRDAITKQLLASSTCFAGQGLCIATARYGDERAAEDLVAYLRVYLPVGDRQFDQEWAIGALSWLDARLGANRGGIFLAEPSYWKVTYREREIGALNPSRGIDTVRRVMAFLDERAAAKV